MKTILVLGASSDIGSALIERIGDDYDVIWAHYRRSNDRIESLAARFDGRIRFLQADFSVKEDIIAMIDAIMADGTLPDHIVHIPMSKYEVKKFAKTEPEEFGESMSVALDSAVMVLHAFLPAMKKNHFGRVVFMLSSVTGDETPANQSAYVTVKYALLGFMKSLAAEYEGTGVCINAVSPDMVRTKYLDSLPERMTEMYAMTRPDGRILEVSDVIPHIAGLLEEELNVTGTNVFIM